MVGIIIRSRLNAIIHFSQSCLTLCDPMECSTPGFPVHHQLPEPTQTRVHCVADAIQPSHPLSPPSSLALNVSQHQAGFSPMSRLFTSGGQSIGVSASTSIFPKYTQDWSPLREWTGWISLKFKGLWRVFSNNHSSKASILRCSAFFMVQLSYPYMTTGKTLALTTWSFIGRVMSLFFKMLSRSVIAFLPRSKCWGCWLIRVVVAEGWGGYGNLSK